MDGLQAFGVAVVFVLAGGVKGITGMGLPTVAVSLLGLWMAPTQAAALLVAPSLATNVAQCRGPHWRRLLATHWPAWLMLAIVTVWAPEVSDAPSPVDAHRLLGAVLVMYGLWGLWRPELADRPVPARWVGATAGAIAGAITGFVTAATAVFVMPLVPYLQQAVRLDRDAMVQALGLSFTVATLALALRLQASEGPAPLLSAQSALALAAAFVGLGLGTRVRTRISRPAFQRALSIVFVGLGVANLWRGS
ncbi:MAG: sulfite exporter TauE/SafE family protein [Burkholderiales bacterium]|nr:sulfite exporter TauE/SafE family protein [Burkholderiales bacterium]